MNKFLLIVFVIPFFLFAQNPLTTASYWWKEGTGIVVDGSNRVVSWTDNNSSEALTDTATVALDGDTLEFADPGHLRSAADIDGLDPLAGSFSFSAKYRYATPSVTRGVVFATAFRNGSAAAIGWGLFLHAGGMFGFITDGPNEVSNTEILENTVGQTYIVTFVIDRGGDTMQAYLDGVADGAASDVSSVGSINNTTVFSVGVYSDNTRYLGSGVQSLAYDAKAWTAAEVLAAYNCMNSGDCGAAILNHPASPNFPNFKN